MCCGIMNASRLAPIASVGVDSWGVDYLLLDAELQRVGDAICYRDPRTRAMIERVTKRMPAAEIYRRTGIQFQPFNTIYQLTATARQEPGWLDQANHLLMIPDYLHYRLSGIVANEYTNATTTQLLNLKGEWDPDIFAAAGLTGILMQPPVEAGTILGAVRLGGIAAQVVAPASHDTASAVLATPLVSDTEIFLSSGTWSLMGMESMHAYSSLLAMRLNFSNEGGFGRRFRVLKNIMGLWLVQRLSQEFHTSVDEALLDATEKSAPWRSIVNPDDTRFLNPASMTDAIRDYCRETQQPEPESFSQFARCTFESLALSYRLTKEELENLRGSRLTRIHIVGGGSKNRLLNQLCADACQLPVSAGPVEASALGNICAQMIAMGEISGIDEARALIRRSFEIDEYGPHNHVPDWVWEQFQQYAATSRQEEIQ